MSDDKESILVFEVLGLARRPAVNFFDLAVRLKKLHELKPSCMQYLSDKTGINKRRLYYYLDVGRLIEGCGLRQPEVEAVGWTKLQIIARHVKGMGGASSGEITRLLESAAQTPALKLRSDLRGFEAPGLKSVVFRLNAVARTELDTALVAFGAKRTFRGLAEKEDALMELVRVSMLKRR